MTVNLPCRKCGADTGHSVEFEVQGKQGATFAVCEPCMDAALVEFAERRRQFEALLADGVDRATANKIMIARIDDGEVAS